MLSKQEVQHISELARLGLSSKEIAKHQKDLSAILDYIGQLKQADIGGVNPTSHSIDLENVIRKDEAEKESPERINKMMEQAPQKQGGYIKTKAIF